MSYSTKNGEAVNALNKMNDKKTVISWGIVGLGDVTTVKSGPPFWKCEGSELVAVMRRTPGKAVEFAANVPPGQITGTKCVGYEDLEEFLRHPGLDAVYISTRPGTHLEIGRQVAAAGKACYVEKPVGRCAQETIELNDIFQKAGLPLYTAYISRAYERTQALRKLLAEGAIGEKLQRIQYTLRGTGGARDMEGELPWRLDPSQSGGGLLLDVGCHVLDRIDYLCGPLESLVGYSENRNSPKIPVEDYCHLEASTGKASWASMKNDGCEGASVECIWDFASRYDPIDELTFIGSSGSIRMAGTSPDGPIQVFGTNGSMQQNLNFEKPEHTAQRLVQAVTDDLIAGSSQQSKNVDFLSYGDNAVRTSIVIDAILRNYYGTRDIGYWEDKQSWPGKPSLA
jgi:predicted dehydrogenase